MHKRIPVRPLTPDEQHQLEALSQSRAAPSHERDRAVILLRSAAQAAPGRIAAEVDCGPGTISDVVKRFNARGMKSLKTPPAGGKPVMYDEAQCDRMIALARTPPQDLNLPYSHWTLTRMAEYVNSQLCIPISRSRLADIVRGHWVKGSGKGRPLSASKP